MFSPPIPTAKSLSLPNHTHQKPSHTLLLLNPHSNISNFHPNHHKLLKPISASQLPSPPSSSSSSPHTHHPSQPQSFSPNDLLHILRNRHGHLWHQYALHISTLYHNFSFSGPAVEESTGISCAEQDRLVAAAQVRNSLIAAEVAPKVVSFFDSAAGVHLLYELRLLSDPQLLTVAARQIAARRVENPQTAQDVARAMQDFPQWKGQAFQLALEKNQFANGAELEAGLRRALEVSEAQWLKERVPEFRKADEVWQAVRAHLPVVSIKMGMVENSALVVRMPVCSAEEGEWGVASLPGCQKVGGFGTVTAEKPPGRWVVLPAWKGLVNTGKAGVVVRFKDGSVLPWELGGVFNIEDEILVVVKRGKKAVVREDRFYLVVNSVGGGLRVEKGGRLKDEEVEDRLGIVVLVVRIPAKATAHDLQYLEDTPAEDSDSNAPHFQIPTIDFNGVDSDRRTEIIDEIRQASETWGCFQLVDHGIPISILDNVIEGVRRFHEQPKEAKSDLYTHDIRKEPIPIKEGLANFHRHQLIVGNWRDSLNCVFHIDPLQPEELPEICKDDVLEFEKQVFKLGETLFGLISEALGLSTTYLQELGFMKPMLMGCNYYRPHPWPELFCPNEHADDVFLAIILQNHIGGLQVLHQQSWINVEPVRGALIVNIGKFLQLATNGKLKAVVHRVLAKRAGPRISLASFFHHLPAPKIDLHRMKGLICSEKPAKSNAQELIADEEPANCNA